MIKRFAVFVSLVVVVASLLAIPADAEVQDDAVDMAEQDMAKQDEAAKMVMEQLEAADEPVPMEEIEALEDLGPAPWLSFMPERSAEVVGAWTEVAEQLPESAMGARHRPRGDRGPIDFTESEEADEVGAEAYVHRKLTKPVDDARQTLVGAPGQRENDVVDSMLARESRSVSDTAEHGNIEELVR